jgi:MFS family permease
MAHGFELSSAGAADGGARPWYRLMNRYHWFVLAVAALGWLFDTMDQQLFVLARPAAMEDLIHPTPGVSDAKSLDLERRMWGDYATSIFIAGWATGGLIFGMLGDRIGRARTMLITILMYSICTGLSALSRSPWDFAFYRLLTGLGVGGEFAVGVSLVAEVMPGRARPYALALLQALSGIGNVSAAVIFLGLNVAREHDSLSGTILPTALQTPWRLMFVIGAVPAVLTLVIMRRLKEPEAWQRASHEGMVGQQLGSYRELFRDPVLRKHALFGLVLGCSGVIGLWSVGFFTPDLIRFVQRGEVTQRVYNEQLEAATAAGDEAKAHEIQALFAAKDNPTATSPTASEQTQKELERAISGQLARSSGYTSIALNIGAALGMLGFGALAQRIGRRPTFAIAFTAAIISTLAVFAFLHAFWQIWVLVPVMGFCQLSLFSGYAIYFPELFPTRLRSTGTSFCYNVGRFVAAFGPVVKSQLEMAFRNTPEPLRYAGCTMCLVFVIGLFALPFLPETRNRPLPE